MTPERWQQIEELFHAALEREPSQRAAFLAEACAGDEALRREIESLLAAHEQAGSFYEEAASELATEWLAGKAQPMVGQTIGHFKILDLVGAGGMGEVYRALDTKLDRTVALKILPESFASDEGRLRRFIREAKAASALNHPHVATIYEIGDSGSTSFIAMEYVEGQTLATRVSERPLDLAEIVDISIQVADALDEAHSKGITHRDIKSANIMITSRGQVKVLDFGLAKISQPEGPAPASDQRQRSVTTPGLVMGTVEYMSPEQVLGHAVDHRTDIFSLGVVLYEMATARLPFSGMTVTETMDQILHAQPEAITRFNDRVPAELDRIAQKCLEKDPGRRYQSARDLLMDLKNLKHDSQAGALAARMERYAT